MSSFSPNAKSIMLDALTANRVQLHSADPGPTGAAFVVGSLTAATFASADEGARALSANVDFTGLTPNESVTWYSVWNSTGPAFYGRGEITSGDVAANAAGEYTLTTGCSLQLNDV